MRAAAQLGGVAQGSHAHPEGPSAAAANAQGCGAPGDAFGVQLEAQGPRPHPHCPLLTSPHPLLTSPGAGAPFDQFVRLLFGLPAEEEGEHEAERGGEAEEETPPRRVPEGPPRRPGSA